MYEAYFGLHARPFQLTPDPAFYFESLTHRKALSYLGYGLAQGEGFIVITGEVGAGKTTLVSHLMATIDSARLTAASIVTTNVNDAQIVQAVAMHFGLQIAGRDKAQLLGEFEAFLHGEARAGRRCLLIVDEAQNLPPQALEELRMLSNFQLGGQALLQIFLLGQPEFRDTLANAPELEQLRQRVIAAHHLDAMGEDEIEPYIAHRMTKAGWTGQPQFAPDLFARVYHETAGIPRIVNTLMSRVLLMAAVEQVEQVDLDLVERVLDDLARDVSQASPEPQPVAASEPEPKPAPAPSPEPAPIMEQPEPAAPVAPPKAPDNVKSIAEVRAEAEQLAKRQADEKQVRDLTSRIDIISKRLSKIEERMETQDTHLHRVLTLLVEWVENDIETREAYVDAGRAA